MKKEGKVRGKSLLYVFILISIKDGFFSSNIPSRSDFGILLQKCLHEDFDDLISSYIRKIPQNDLSKSKII